VRATTRATASEEKDVLKDHKTHATIPVTNLEKARAYYTQTLRLTETVLETAGAVMLSTGSGTRVTIYETPNTQRGGHTQVGFAVDDIDAEIADLKARGVVFEEYDLPGLKTENSVAEYEGNKAAWFKDPDNNIIGLVQLP
jgi:catechol 2,3-dioxygenase-like lactoylglutathione lyase family enzyme